MAYRLLSVNLSPVGLVEEGATALSAVGKRPTSADVTIHGLGLEGDEHGSSRVDGGVSKAVYAYPHEHYVHWQTMRSQTRAPRWNEELPLGAMGENLSLEGLLESDVWIGDVLKFPRCALAVSEPGRPSLEFAAAMGFPQASQMMVQSGWCGFYLAVRLPGTIAAGESFDLVPGPRHIGIRERFASVTRNDRRRP